MASLRDSIAEALTATFGALPGVTAWRRDRQTSLQFDGILCVVNVLGESKRPELELFYDCTLRIGITIVVNREDASPTLDGSLEVRYIDRAVALLEQTVHSSALPADGYAVIVGHDTAVPAEENQIAAGLELRVSYRHDWNNPDTYNPGYA